MERSPERKIITIDFIIVSSCVFNFVIMVQIATSSVELWWIAVSVATVTGMLSAAADRSPAGLWAMIAVGAIGMIGILYAGATSTLPIEIFPWFFLGLAIGVSFNRVLFGIVWPIPDLRRRRTLSK
ncbi:hypothetical protein SAMN05421858_4415 [Haladaptatus litoreus]|uniref:Uncharacterized protein n=1 Tax=Haladaptatus litoreus TaxID=553468 RepID=A0A1N7EMV5_9EURY|nr:hypothetical protein [Haladaptatus litoreus]SIR89406.1 hypothetical protein SAMN05421858_4415 [Haladaptatus litoreus]